MDRKISKARRAAPPFGLCIVATIALVVGCAKPLPPGRAAVDAVDFDGTNEVSPTDIEEKLATQPSPRFAGVFPGIFYDYEIFDRNVLQRDLDRVVRYYQARGFHQARARAARLAYSNENTHVRVTVEVEEGPPTLVRTLEIGGLAGLPKDVVEAATHAVADKIEVGARFKEAAYADAEEALERALFDHGYAYAHAGRSAEIDLPRHAADVAFAVVPGPRATFGEVEISGLGDIPEAPVRRALDIAPGEPYSESALEAAKQAVLDLGVFSAVEIEPDRTASSEEKTTIPIKVRVEPSRLNELQLGGGAELDVMRTDLHLVAGWQGRNFLGGLRRFSLSWKPGLVFYPTRLPALQAPTAYLPMEKFRAELRQPGFLEARTGGLARLEFNIYPVILSPEVDESAPVLGYREFTAAVGLDRSYGHLYSSITHNLQTNFPFTYEGELDPDLTSVVISYVDLGTHLDFRNDAIHPHKGVYVENDLQFAGVGGDARDVKVHPEARGYVPLGRATIALRAGVGFLFPLNYGDSVGQGGQPKEGVSRADWVRDAQLTYFRAFFSGGPSSNRGYAVRGVGPHGVVPFFNPGLAAQQLAQDCGPGSPTYDPVRCALPLGGQSLWEASLELRVPLAGALTGDMFCDASDVSPTRVDIRLDRPHLSCGIGARYDTPVGPIRLDIGYRIPGLQTLVPVDPRVEGDPGEILGLPIAVAFGVGEAF